MRGRTGRAARWLALVFLLGGTAVGVLYNFGIGRTVQIRRDTGDLRYCFLGFPLIHENMPEPLRTRLLKIAAVPPPQPARWRTVYWGRASSTNNPHLMLRDTYCEASLWADVDPRIGRFALREGIMSDLSDFAYDYDASDAQRVKPGWREDEGVLDYLDARGYTPALLREDPANTKERLLAEEPWWGNTPLHRAALGGYRDAAELLLGDGADVNARNGKAQTPLHLAAWTGHTEVAQVLLDHGADLQAHDGDGLTPLYVAVEHGQEETARALLRVGAEEDILVAAGLGDSKVVEGFLKREPELINAKGYGTPLDWAAEQGRAETVKLLLDKGADCNAADWEGDTPLHAAAEGGHAETAEMLLRHGAEVNAEGKDGETPLHRAAQKGHAQMVRLLLEWGADTGARAANGLTPRDFAWRYCHDEIAEMLR